MTLLALLVLGLRLGQVDVDARTGLLCVCGYRLNDLRVGGVLAVDAQITDQAAAVLAVQMCIRDSLSTACAYRSA